MRFLLLLSAILTALVGAGAGDRVASAQTHQAIAQSAAAVSSARETAIGNRPMVRRVGLNEVVSIALPPSPVHASHFIPVFAARLRI